MDLPLKKLEEEMSRKLFHTYLESYFYSNR